MTAAHPPSEATSIDQRLDSSTAWLMVGATFVSTFTVFGVAYSFGAFFGAMADEFGTDRGETALFFSITTFLYFGLGVVSGQVADRRGPRPVLVFGAVSMVIGLLLTARVQSITLGYVTYGLGVGIGVACGYVPMVAAVGGWFQRQRTTALGAAVAGIGVGTLAVSPLNEYLVDTYGWRRTYEICAVGAAVLLGAASLATRRPPIATGGPPPIALSTIRSSPDFAVLYSSMAMMSMALFVPFVFLPDYLELRGVSGSAGWLVGAIGISSVVGRLSLGRLAARIPARSIYEASFLVLGSSFALWLLAGESYLLLLVFTLVMGVAYGGIIALGPAVMAEIYGTASLGGLLGLLYTAAGLGGLLGPPLAGGLIDGAGYTTAVSVAMGLGVGSWAILRAGRRFIQPLAPVVEN
jgi:MFS family permease